MKPLEFEPAPTVTRRAARQSEFVYFVLAEKTQMVKIGISRHMQQRLQALQVGSPDRLRVLAVIRCDDPQCRESQIHRLFRSDRHHGEWFSFTPAIDRYIAEHGRTLDQDRIDVQLAMMDDLIASGFVAPCGTETNQKRMSRKAVLAQYKMTRGIE